MKILKAEYIIPYRVGVCTASYCGMFSAKRIDLHIKRKKTWKKEYERELIITGK